jgi:hypothetical protein
MQQDPMDVKQEDAFEETRQKKPRFPILQIIIIIGLLLLLALAAGTVLSASPEAAPTLDQFTVMELAGVIFFG